MDSNSMPILRDVVSSSGYQQQVAETPVPSLTPSYMSSATTGMLSFLARLSGRRRRRHVRRFRTTSSSSSSSSNSTAGPGASGSSPAAAGSQEQGAAAATATVALSAMEEEESLLDRASSPNSDSSCSSNSSRHRECRCSYNCDKLLEESASSSVESVVVDHRRQACRPRPSADSHSSSCSRTAASHRRASSSSSSTSCTECSSPVTTNTTKTTTTRTRTATVAAAATTTITTTTRRQDCNCCGDRDILRQIRRVRRRSSSRSTSTVAVASSTTTKRTQQKKRYSSGISYSIDRVTAFASKARSRLGSFCISPYLATLLLLSYSLIGVTDACSSRSTPKPRPPTPTPRPNITFHMYSCPPDYAEWYCLNGATCFTVKIVDSLLYNCLCSNGYIGQRCEFKDLDGTYLPSRQRVMLETASIAGAVTIAVFLAVITFISVYIHCKRKQKELRMMSSGVDAVDGPARDPELRPFCSRSRSLMIFMAKNPNSSTIGPSIEQTRMPNWNFSAETSTRLASVNENKRPSHH